MIPVSVCYVCTVAVHQQKSDLLPGMVASLACIQAASVLAEEVVVGVQNANDAMSE